MTPDTEYFGIVKEIDWASKKDNSIYRYIIEIESENKEFIQQNANRLIKSILK